MIEARFVTVKGIGKDSCIFYKQDQNIKFSKVAKIEHGNMLYLSDGTVMNEEDMDLIERSYSIISLLDNFSRIELFMNGDIFSFNLNSVDKKSEVEFYLNNSTVKILAVSRDDLNED